MPRPHNSRANALKPSSLWQGKGRMILPLSVWAEGPGVKIQRGGFAWLNE